MMMMPWNNNEMIITRRGNEKIREHTIKNKRRKERIKWDNSRLEGKDEKKKTKKKEYREGDLDEKTQLKKKEPI